MDIQHNAAPMYDDKHVFINGESYRASGRQR